MASTPNTKFDYPSFLESQYSVHTTAAKSNYGEYVADNNARHPVAEQWGNAGILWAIAVSVPVFGCIPAMAITGISINDALTDNELSKRLSRLVARFPRIIELDLKHFGLH
ncbi:hypothetical protein AKJ16_DCAP04777, partial [Drosera capensis]